MSPSYHRKSHRWQDQDPRHWPADPREEYEERAAIMEHCGGLDRVAAEALARRRVTDRWVGLES